MSKSGIVNVRMVITEEKILSNIEKVQKMINPKSKKQIIELDDDIYFKDLIESIKTYLIEYPKKKNFPGSVYKAAYGLVEFATNQFEENTKNIEELIRQREENISLANELKVLVEAVSTKEEGWQDKLKENENKFAEDIIDTLDILGKCESAEEDNYKDAMKLLKARINNLESNLHIEIDMERIEDRSKALSYIGIEVADALKTIPTPIFEEEKVEEQVVEKAEVVEPAKVEKIEKVEKAVKQEQVKEQVQNVVEEEQQYIEETTFEAKPSLWQRFKESKFIRAVKYIMKVRVVLQYPALPEGRGENSL